ncbi:MAG: bifunctional DNA-formamidopyrimidine glycosylase/DNA-(apurinic or apyrimidinic site) lyase [Anaerolineaceae bacterium]
MPELPEVETIVRELRAGQGRSPAALPGLRIRTTQFFWEGSLASPGPEEFIKSTSGQTVVDVARRGKFILLQLTSGVILVHLRMSGDLRVEKQSRTSPADEPLLPHDRLAILLEGDLELIFNDPRKFGRLWFARQAEEVTGALGPEPLSDSFRASDLFEKLQARHRQIKPLLLDQSFLAGVGNIYADESLHRARLHPGRRSDSLSKSEATKLWAAIRETLQLGIDRNGASIDWVYRGGEFQNNFQVYQQTGKPCPTCGRVIERIVVGQRGTHFCPSCQLQKE